MKNLPIRKRNSGQALLIVLLTMAVILTVVLSTVSRSITDIQTTQLEEDSLRAFSAAEAGVERALVNLVPGTTFDVELDPGEPGQPSYEGSIEVSDVGGTEFVSGQRLISGESATFWFANHDTNGNLKCDSSPANCLDADSIEICWGEEGSANVTNETPAIEVSVYHLGSAQTDTVINDLSTLQVARKAYDPSNLSTLRQLTNKFVDVKGNSCTGGVDGVNLAFSTGTISFANNTGSNILVPETCRENAGCILLVKVKMLYNNANSHPLGIDVVPNTGGLSLPAQGYTIDSTGKAGDATRKVNVFQAFAEPPFIFDSAVFSKTDLVK